MQSPASWGAVGSGGLRHLPLGRVSIFMRRCRPFNVRDGSALLDFTESIRNRLIHCHGGRQEQNARLCATAQLWASERHAAAVLRPGQLWPAARAARLSPSGSVWSATDATSVWWAEYWISASSESVSAVSTPRTVPAVSSSGTVSASGTVSTPAISTSGTTPASSESVSAAGALWRTAAIRTTAVWPVRPEPTGLWSSAAASYAATRLPARFWRR
jgi:hypothetical protein